MFQGIFQKYKLGKLYRHIPKENRNEILLRTEHFDRIGPIRIPSEIEKQVVDLNLYFYSCYKSKNEYFLITKNDNLKFHNPYLRISSNCFYAYMVNSRRCDCKWQLNQAYQLLQNQNDADFLIIFAIDDHGKGIDGGLRGHALLYLVELFSIEKPYDKYLSEELGMKKQKLGHKLNLNGFNKKDIEIYGLSQDTFNS